MAKDYTVGYGRPPKHSQFPKGKSGNPKGRQKGTPNVKSTIAALLAETIVMREQDRQIRVTVFEALLRVLRGRALKGDLKCLSWLIDTAMKLGDQTPEARDPEDALEPEDQKILDAYESQIAARVKRSAGGSNA